MESQARVDLDPVNLESQAPGHLLAETGALHPVGDIRHLAVASLVNQVVASQARADPRAHHPAVETGVTAAGDHTEVGARHLVPAASLVNQDPRVHRAVEIGDTVEVGVITEVGARHHRQARVERAMEEEYRALRLSRDGDMRLTPPLCNGRNVLVLTSCVSLLF